MSVAFGVSLQKALWGLVEVWVGAGAGASGSSQCEHCSRHLWEEHTSSSSLFGELLSTVLQPL